MSLEFEDTIAALASPPGPAARGIVRVSGSVVCNVLDVIFEADDPDAWRTQRRGAGRHPGAIWLATEACADDSELAGRTRLPVAVHLWPTRRSYTGQPMAELHLAGSPPLLEAVLSMLFDNDVRPARPGEFTLRAFLAGRVDLLQAEAVLGVIDAHDHEELNLALQQLAGGLSGKLSAVRGDLLDLLAELEAGLDFVEEDIEFVSRADVQDRVSAARETLDELLKQAAGRMQSTGRSRVVLAGLPNAGKSTLFNVLAGRPAALVSEVEGTTRDYLTASLDRDGLNVELIDTAGWETDADQIMSAAGGLRADQFEQSDVIVWCSACDLDELACAADAEIYSRVKQQHRHLIRVWTKSDVVPPQGAEETELLVSAQADVGLPELLEAVSRQLSATHSGSRQLLGTTAARSRASLVAAGESLRRAFAVAESGEGEELVALEVREALDHLGRILGVVYTDDVLDRVFSKFCIGK